LGTKISPLDELNKANWDIKNEKEHGLSRKSILYDLQFNLQWINTLDDAWKKLETMSGKRELCWKIGCFH